MCAALKCAETGHFAIALTTLGLVFANDERRIIKKLIYETRHVMQPAHRFAGKGLRRRAVNQ